MKKLLASPLILLIMVGFIIVVPVLYVLAFFVDFKPGEWVGNLFCKGKKESEL